MLSAFDSEPRLSRGCGVEGYADCRFVSVRLRATPLLPLGDVNTLEPGYAKS